MLQRDTLQLFFTQNVCQQGTDKYFVVDRIGQRL